MLSFVTAINAIGSQVWAFILVVLGSSLIVVCHKNGIDIGIGAGVIGAGVNMFTSQASKSSTQVQPSGFTTISQITEAPGVQGASFPSTSTAK